MQGVAVVHLGSAVHHAQDKGSKPLSLALATSDLMQCYLLNGTPVP